MNDIIRISSIEQVHKALGFSAPRHPLVSLIPIDKSIVEYDYGDATYVFDFYQISLKAGIIGSVTYGRNSYDFSEGSMIFSKPGQVFQFKEKKMIDEEVEGGWTLLFHPDLIIKSNLGKNINQYSFFTYDVSEALHISDEERATLDQLVAKIEREYKQNIDRHSQKLIIANIELILDYCLRYYDRQFYMRSNLNQDLISRFEAMLQQYFDEERCLDEGIPTVTFCGDSLNMSPQYLSDMLKKETGQTTLQHIQNFVIERAKVQLLNTKEQVSQIAYGLGFEYPQHFSKLFKAKTGMSPAEFRTVH
ncbi:helix-turn-helix domain-containing protein [Curvivirga sp.]|uniref:helix-turn-helix domain-containing protein n=1 Tax=Curvivirga sp. TaxID=2856848 RepID=UPI003B594A0C